MGSSQRPLSVDLYRYVSSGGPEAHVEVLECPAFALSEERTRWMKCVAEEAPEFETHFVGSEGDSTFTRRALARRDASARAPHVHACVSDFIRRRFAPVSSRVQLLADGEAPLELPIDESFSGPPPIIEPVWTPAGLEAQIALDLKDSLPRLAAQLRSRLSVMPFVGAGMSARFGLPQWRAFLDDLAERIVEPADLAQFKLEEDLEQLAERLWLRDEDAFQNAIEARFNADIDEQELRAGPLAILAQLVDGPVITTNFDHVLEDTFQACGRAFEQTVHGARPDSIVRAIHQDRRHLLKIHGDCRDRAMRTFTLSEYEQSYGGPARAPTLTSLGWLMFTQRPLLFLGCSLEKDRTVDVLRNIHGQLRGVTHYAILAAKHRSSALIARRRELAALGVAPLWFAPGDFAHIERHLENLLESSNSRELTQAPPARTDSPRPDSGAPFEVIGVRTRPTPLSASTERIAGAIRDARVAFLLGNYVHLGAICSGDAFYEEMRKHFGAPATLRDRAEVARFVLDRVSPKELLDWYRGFINVDRVAPSKLVRLLVELPRFLRSRGRADAAALTLVTTNYDCVLEHAFEAAGEPFHTFYYRAEDGSFAYRAPNGAERIIERPERFPAPRDQHVCLVKLNGGLPYGQAIPHSVCIARGDFERLAARLPQCLPAGVRGRLEGRQLVCLGHGLFELDVEEFVRYLHRTGAKRASWAVQKVPAQFQADFDTRREYWRPIGLEIVDHDLGEFTDQLSVALAK